MPVLTKTSIPDHLYNGLTEDDLHVKGHTPIVTKTQGTRPLVHLSEDYFNKGHPCQC